MHMRRIDPRVFHLLPPSAFGEKLGREDAYSNTVESDLLSHATQIAQENGMKDPEAIANFTIEYQQAYRESHKVNTDFVRKHGKRGR